MKEKKKTATMEGKKEDTKKVEGGKAENNDNVKDGKTAEGLVDACDEKEGGNNVSTVVSSMAGTIPSDVLQVGVVNRITQMSSQVQDALHLLRVPMASNKLKASLVYTRFHGISKRSNSLISIAQRGLNALGSGSFTSARYKDLLALCHNAYCGARETLLTLTVRHYMDALQDRHGLAGMTRLASVFLIRLCTIEMALYLDFFGDREKRRSPA